MRDDEVLQITFHRCGRMTHDNGGTSFYNGGALVPLALHPHPQSTEWRKTSVFEGSVTVAFTLYFGKCHVSNHAESDTHH